MDKIMQSNGVNVAQLVREQPAREYDSNADELSGFSKEEWIAANEADALAQLRRV